MRYWLLKHQRQKLLKRCANSAMQDYLKTPVPRLTSDYRSLEYLAVDLEMTGLNAETDQIVSIGFVPILQGKVSLELACHLLIKPSAEVGQSAVIHGIRDKDLEQADSLEQAMVLLLEALAGRVLLLHCAPLDLGFLNRACKRLYQVSLSAPVVDTMAIERARLQLTGTDADQQSLRLSDCRRRYGLPDYEAHNALVDALATAELFLAQTTHRFNNAAAKFGKLVSGQL